MSNYNPYPSQPPFNPYGEAQTTNYGMPSGYRSAGLVGHVMAIGILQIVLGALEVLMTAMLVFYSAILPTIAANQKSRPQEAEMMNVVSQFMIGFAIALGILALLRIMTGVCCLFMKHRVATIISLILGFATCLTFYCAPFAIGIGVYGLIVMFNREVVEAYRLVASGQSVNAVKDYFSRGIPLPTHPSSGM